jgi:hypothetical protein
MLSPAVWLKLSPRGVAHAFAGSLAQALAACFLPLSFVGVASSPRSRASSSSAFPVLLGL